MQNEQTHLEGVPFVTDVDLKIIRDRIEDTPETTELLSGLPRYLVFLRNVCRKDKLIARVNRINLEAMNGLYGLYHLAQRRVAEKLVAICNTPEVIVTVHPFVRQMAMGFLGLVVAQCLQ